jgi:hypothetical protein
MVRSELDGSEGVRAEGHIEPLATLLSALLITQIPPGILRTLAHEIESSDRCKVKLSKHHLLQL